MRVREHEPLHVPELIEPEALNALRGLVPASDASYLALAEALDAALLSGDDALVAQARISLAADRVRFVR